MGNRISSFFPLENDLGPLVFIQIHYWMSYKKKPSRSHVAQLPSWQSILTLDSELKWPEACVWRTGKWTNLKPPLFRLLCSGSPEMEGTQGPWYSSLHRSLCLISSDHLLRKQLQIAISKTFVLPSQGYFPYNCKTVRVKDHYFSELNDGSCNMALLWFQKPSVKYSVNFSSVSKTCPELGRDIKIIIKLN